MVGTVYIYYEGDRRLQSGFRRFFDSLYHRGVKIRLVAGEGDAIADFVTGMKTNRNALSILLKDSEGLGVEESIAEVRNHDHWESDLNNQVDDSQLHFMVQVMESWFLADRSALRSFYGQRFLDNRLPRNPSVEEIPKGDVENGLHAATERTQKGRYHKTSHAPKILATINTARVRAAAPACERLFSELERALA